MTKIVWKRSYEPWHAHSHVPDFCSLLFVALGLYYLAGPPEYL